MTPAPEARDAFAAELDQAIRASGLTLSALKAQLDERGAGISLATLSSWRSGARRPDPARSRAVIEALELILQTPRGTLMGRMSGSSRRVGTVLHLQDSAARADTTETLRELDVTPAESIRFLSINETVRVGERGAVEQIESVIFLQCVSDQVISLGFVLSAVEPTAALPSLNVVAGGELDRSYAHPDRRCFGFRVTLGRVLRPGDSAMLSLVFRFPEAYPARRWHETSVRRPVRELIHWIRFSPGYAPDWADETQIVRGLPRLRTLEIDTSGSVHSIRNDFGPGTLRIRWGDDATWD